MAAFANGKVFAAKRALPVMTSHATWSAPGGVMIERLRLRDLPALWHPGANLMTLVAGGFLMLRMAEADPKCLRELRRARISSELVTGAAGRNVASTRLRARRVALITGRMRIKARGN